MSDRFKQPDADLQRVPDVPTRASEHNEFQAGFADDRASTAAARQLQAVAHASPRHHSAIALQQKANSDGLPQHLQAGVESLSGLSMEHVTVHYNPSRPAQLNAHAYAQGSEIHLAPGQEQHLPHEAWHLVQQAQGRVRPTMQMHNGVAVNDDRQLEAEADAMGAKAAASAVRDLPSLAPPAARTQAVQTRAVLQRFVDTSEASTWLATELPNYTNTALMTARLQPYVDAFREHVALWDQYQTDANQQSVAEQQKTLQRMHRRAVAQDSIEAHIGAQKGLLAPRNVTAEMTLALAFTAPECSLRKYASGPQQERMTELYAMYNSEALGRTAYIARLHQIALEVRSVPMAQLEHVTTAHFKQSVKKNLNLAREAFPVPLRGLAVDAEVPLLKASIEAAALISINGAFAAIGTTLDQIEAAHTAGSDVPAKLAPLRAFCLLHNNAVLDARESEPIRAWADALKIEARDFVNAQFAEIINAIAPVRSIIDVSMAGERALDAYHRSLAQILAFTALHRDHVLDTRDYGPILARPIDSTPTRRSGPIRSSGAAWRLCAVVRYAVRGRRGACAGERV